MSEEVEYPRLPLFIKFMKKEIEKTNSRYKLAGYAIAGHTLMKLAEERLQELPDKE